MSAANDGGPAFPVPDSHHANGQVQYGANGMSLRDWLASQATQDDVEGFMPDGVAECAQMLGIEFSEWNSAHYAQLRCRAKWAYADAMLAAREVKKEAP